MKRIGRVEHNVKGHVCMFVKGSDLGSLSIMLFVKWNLMFV